MDTDKRGANRSQSSMTGIKGNLCSLHKYIMKICTFNDLIPYFKLQNRKRKKFNTERLVYLV